MTKMTKAQLVDENIALRHNIETLSAQLADVNAQLAALSAKHAALQAQAQSTECIVATYTKRDGSVWNKVRIGYNLFVHRPA